MDERKRTTARKSYLAKKLRDMGCEVEVKNRIIRMPKGFSEKGFASSELISAFGFSIEYLE